MLRNLAKITKLVGGRVGTWTHTAWSKKPG